MLALIVAVFLMVFTKGTLNSQKQTEANTYRLEPRVQKKLLEKMCQHLYRNMVVSYTIKTKIEKEKGKGKGKISVYPSEEHLVKMKVNLEDIHDEIFYKEEEHFSKISRLYVLLRNYNAELDIICAHLSSPTIDDGTKERDIRTLLFKCHNLIEEIVDFTNSVWPGQVVNEVHTLIEKEWRGDKKKVPDHKGTDTAILGFEPYQTTGTVFTDKLFGGEPEVFLAHFNEDVRVEMGNNNEDAEKIHMIKFA